MLFFAIATPPYDIDAAAAAMAALLMPLPLRHCRHAATVAMIFSYVFAAILPPRTRLRCCCGVTLFAIRKALLSLRQLFDVTFSLMLLICC